MAQTTALWTGGGVKNKKKNKNKTPHLFYGGLTLVFCFDSYFSRLLTFFLFA
jgi:hypothetical protein